MPCPNCEHTMQLVGQSNAHTANIYWCPRCGTAKWQAPEGASGVWTPRFVERSFLGDVKADGRVRFSTRQCLAIAGHLIDRFLTYHLSGEGIALTGVLSSLVSLFASDNPGFKRVLFWKAVEERIARGTEELARELPPDTKPWWIDAGNESAEDESADEEEANDA